METVVGVKGIDEAELNETVAEKHCSYASQLPKQIDESVVYKLVRVQGDGRFVPATEDEVMEVKDLLEGDKMEINGIEDSEQTMECISCEDPYSGELPIEDSEGMKADNSEDTYKLNGQHEYIGEMFQTVNQEEKLLLSCGSPDHSFAYLNVDIQCSYQHDDMSAIDEKLQSGFPCQENSSPSLSDPSDNYNTQSKTAAECSNFSDEPLGNISTAFSLCTTSKPPTNGEICLGNLSIRELHETFKVTFGRETTVKDKQWLKRRIAMGLSNSCDVSTMSFVFRNNKWTKKVNEESSKSVEGAHIMEAISKSVNGITKDSIVRAIDNNSRRPPISHNNRMEDHRTDSGKMLGNTLDYGRASDYLQSEDRAAKRVRKPTKRYIEELSEVESRDFTGKLLPPDKDSGQGQTSLISSVRHVRNVISDARAVVTRTNSLGGSGIQIPIISRVRRSRPRKNVLSLMKLNPRGTGIATKLVKKALSVHNSQPNETGHEVLKAKSPQKFQQQLVSMPEEDDQCLASHTVEPEKDDQCLASDTVEPQKNDQCLVLDMVEPEKNNQCLASVTVDLEKNDQCPKDNAKPVDSTEASDDNIVTVPTSKGGMRRKHHRAWTISEVMKLVEGVSRYGAGRWSEIKRISFASYSHRTSVDLKDKWRNLLRASFAQTPPDNGINSRKQASTTPIPAPILLRVRELAEMHAQVPLNLSSGKMVESSGGARSVVHDTRSGYL